MEPRARGVRPRERREPRVPARPRADRQPGGRSTLVRHDRHAPGTCGPARGEAGSTASTREADLFRTILERGPGSTGGLAYREVTSVLEDRRGSLWVGTWGKGLSPARRRKAPSSSGSRAPPDPPFALNTVLALAEQPDGTVWAGSMAGLFRIDPTQRERDRQRARAGGPSRASAPGTSTPCWWIAPGRLWVGTGGGGLHRLEPDGRSFARFVSDAADADEPERRLRHDDARRDRTARSGSERARAASTPSTRESSSLGALPPVAFGSRDDRPPPRHGDPREQARDDLGRNGRRRPGEHRQGRPAAAGA